MALDVMIALAILAGPLLAILHLVHANLRVAQALRARALALSVLEDAAQLALDRGEPEAAIAERVEKLPRELRGLAGGIRGTLRSDVAPGLSRLELIAALPDGGRLRTVILFRPAARARLEAAPACPP